MKNTITIKGLIFPGAKVALNTYAPVKSTPKHVRQIELRGEARTPTPTVGDSMPFVSR